MTFNPSSPPQTPDELHALLVHTFNITVPRVALVSSNTAPFDYLCHAYFEGRVPGKPAALSPDCVVWASRGGGKTFLGAVATMLDLVFKPGIEIRILGGSLEQSSRMFAHLRTIFEHPQLASLVEGRVTERQIKLRSGSRVQVLAQSETAVRGTRVQKLRCDEVDLFDRDIWEAAQLTTRSLRLPGPWGQWVRGSVEALSTMHRPMGIMFELVGGIDAAMNAATAKRESPTTSLTINGAPAESSEAPTTPPRPRRSGPRARTLFRWGVIDVLETCEPARECATCALYPECQGRAKRVDNPKEGGHVAIDDAIDQKGRVSVSAWACEMLALRPKRDDAVFPEFDPARHITVVGPPRLVGRARDDTPEPLLPSRNARGESRPRLVAGMDFGYRGLTVVLWGLVDPLGVLTIVDERALAQQRLETHIDAIIDSPWGLPDWIGVDPAGRQSNQQTGRSNIEAMTRRGLKVRWRSIGVAPGVALVRTRLDPAAAAAELDSRAVRRSPSDRPPTSEPSADTLVLPPPPRLLIDARCATLIESLQRHHYDPDRPDRYDPVKDGTDHAADALRYLVVNLDQPHRTARHAHGSVWKAIHQ